MAGEPHAEDDGGPPPAPARARKRGGGGSGGSVDADKSMQLTAMAEAMVHDMDRDHAAAAAASDDDDGGGSESAFRSLDADHDGALNAGELSAAVGGAEAAARVLEMGDANHDGTLDPEEWEHVREFTATLLRRYLLPAAITAALEVGEEPAAEEPADLPVRAMAGGPEAAAPIADEVPATPARPVHVPTLPDGSPAATPLQDPGATPGQAGPGKLAPATLAPATPAGASAGSDAGGGQFGRHASGEQLRSPLRQHTRAGALVPNSVPSTPSTPVPLKTDQFGVANINRSFHVEVDSATMQKLRREVVSLPPVNMGPIVAANLKELRQVRRGLRKARRTMAQVPMAMLDDQMAGEATGAAIVQQLRHQAVLRMQQADTLLVAAAGSSWRQVMAIETVEAEGPLVPPELLAAAKVQLATKLTEEAADEQARLADFGLLGADQRQARFVEAAADLSSAPFNRGILARPSGDDLSPWLLGEFVEVVVSPDVSYRAKVMGGAEGGLSALCVLMLGGPDEGRLLDWPREQLQPLNNAEAGESVRLDQIKAAYAGLLEAYDRVKGSVPGESNACALQSMWQL